MANPSETMEDMALINNLNDHCLKHIFSFLSVEERFEIEKVCKRWRMISEQGWNDIKELLIDDDNTNNLIYLVFKRCGSYLKKLKILCAQGYSHSLSMAVEFCRLSELEEINIYNLEFEERNADRNIRDLREIFMKSRKLVAVTIQGFFYNYMLDHLNLLNPKILRKLVIVNSNTEQLSINPDRFPNLKELMLDGVNIIEDEMTREDMSLKGLEAMYINRCVVPKNLIQRIWTFTNLRELGLSHRAMNIKNEHIRQIVKHCHNIKIMALRDSVNQKSDFLQYLGKMQSLEVLNFFNFPMNTRDLAYLTNVKKLSFHLCFDVVETDGLIELIENSSKLDELEFIDIYDMSRTFLDDVERIFQNGQRTKHLIVAIRGRTYEAPSGLEEIIQHPLLEWRVDNDDFVEGENDTDDDDDDHDIS